MTEDVYALDMISEVNYLLQSAFDTSKFKETPVDLNIKRIKQGDIGCILKQDSFFVPKRRPKAKESYVKQLLTSIEYSQFKNQILNDFVRCENWQRLLHKDV